MRLAETDPGSPEARDFSAASSMLSRVAVPRRLGRGALAPARVLALILAAVPAVVPCRVILSAYRVPPEFHRRDCDSAARTPMIPTHGWGTWLSRRCR